MFCQLQRNNQLSGEVPARIVPKVPANFVLAPVGPIPAFDDIQTLVDFLTQ